MRSSTIRPGLSLLALTFLLTPTPLTAQSPGSAWVDSSLRVRHAAVLLREGERFPDSRYVEGTLLDARGDTLRLAMSDGRDVLVLLDDDSVLERKVRTTAEDSGRWIGFLAGLGAGGFVGHATFEPRYVSGCSDTLAGGLAELFGGGCNKPDRQENDMAKTTLGFALLGGMVGAFLGSKIGGRIETDGWVSVGPGQVRVAAGVPPARGGLGAALRLSF